MRISRKANLLSLKRPFSNRETENKIDIMMFDRRNRLGRCLFKRVFLFLWICAGLPETTSALTTQIAIKPVGQIRLSSSRQWRAGSLNAVSSGDSNRTSDPVLRLPLMEAELACRMEAGAGHDNDNDNNTADLRTAIEDARTAVELGVRKSQSEFYEARSAADPEAMDRLWSREESPAARCVHPGMAAVSGRAAVLEAWERYFSVPVPDPSFFAVRPENAAIEIAGGTVAICTCTERTGGGGTLEAVNVYRREDGNWKLTLHQAGPVMTGGRS